MTTEDRRTPREWDRLSDEDRLLVEQDDVLYGESFVVLKSDGVGERLDPASVTVDSTGRYTKND